jgi:HlyD family secretion protein
LNRSRSVLAFATLAVTVLVWFNWRSRPLAVDLLEMAAIDVQTSVVASGRVLPPAKVEIGATITGRVARVPVREGARVRAGELLIELERAELAAAVAQARAAVARARARIASVRTLALPTAQAGLKQAEANLQLAEQDERRSRDLLAKGFISHARLDEAVRQLEVARSALASARANAGAQAAGGAEAQQAQSQLAEAEAALATTEARLAQTRLRAPGDGVVLERQIEPGDILQPGRRAMSLALEGPVRLVVQVDEKNLPLIRPGAVAVAAADAFPGERFEAVVNYISAGVDPARGSVELRLDVAKPPPMLRADMTVSIDLPGPLLRQVLMLPADAVRQLQTDAPWVLVDRGGRAVRTAVRPGLQTQGRVAIAEGLKAGDRVVLSREADDGARIRPRR